MTMLPSSGSGSAFLQESFTVDIFPSKTYAMALEDERVIGLVDGLASMNQAVYKALHTERSTWMAYSNNYGVELSDLIGQPVSYVLPELKRRITEALTWDSRIDSVDGFAFEVNKRKVHATFTVHTIHGDLQAGTEVEI